MESIKRKKNEKKWKKNLTFISIFKWTRYFKKNLNSFSIPIETPRPLFINRNSRSIWWVKWILYLTLLKYCFCYKLMIYSSYIYVCIFFKVFSKNIFVWTKLFLLQKKAKENQITIEWLFPIFFDENLEIKSDGEFFVYISLYI